MSSPEDRIFAQKRSQTTAFTFDDEVADVFDNMIRRSLPGYEMSLEMLGVFARRYAQSGTCIYDLGCSLGAGLSAMTDGARRASARLIGVDSSAAMISRCRARFETAAVVVELHQQLAQSVQFEASSLVVLNFTLQFVPVEQRQDLLARGFSALKPGGALVLSEKLAFESAEEAELCTELHDQFRISQGYTELEIQQKRAALSGVLFPETESVHRGRLRAAGFKSTQLWFRCCNFASFLCVKE